MGWNDLNNLADQFRRAYKQAEGMPDPRDGVRALDQLMAEVLGGDGPMGRQMIDAIKRVMKGQRGERSCEPEMINDGIRQKVGYRVRSGTLDCVFQHRTVYSGSTLAFNQFLENKFGKDDRVVLAFTGWTKPPVDFFRQNDYYRAQLDKLPPEKWPAYAEMVYVDLIKLFLEETFANLKKEVPSFNPVRDLGIIYGVTAEGVDRAIQEYCLEKSIPLVGLTCYDWAEYIPDEAGLPDVYLASDSAEFGKLMADSSNKVVVTGGRAYAANVRVNGEKTEVAERRIPVDLMKTYANIQIPPVVEDYDNFSTAVLNAAHLSKLMPQGNPWEWDVVKRAINGRTTDNEDVFVTTQVVRQELQNLYQVRRLNEQLNADKDESSQP
jgi:hypothetical protein